MSDQVQVNYLNRNFSSIRTDLENYLKAFYPDEWQDFNVASPGMAILDLNAYVGDLLSHLADKKFNSLFLDGVRQRIDAYRLAKTKGYKVPGVRPSLTAVDVIIDVPATSNGPDTSYLPIYRSGLRVAGGGQVFETVEDIDFSSDFSQDGIPNRIINEVLTQNQQLLRYQIVKREKVKAGVTKIIKREITNGNKPFYKFNISDKNVLHIDSVIVYEQLGLSSNPTFSDFNNDSIKWHEVDFLPTDDLFFKQTDVQDASGNFQGYWKEVPRRFEKEFLADGSCRITFGGGVESYDAYEDYLDSLTGVENPFKPQSAINIGDVLDNKALGKKLPTNCTVYVKYRAGGGLTSNVGANVLQEVSNINSTNPGVDQGTNDAVVASTRLNNPFPALGGRGLPSIEEITSNTAANHAAQERCVTLRDYTSRAYQIDGKFGSPFRIASEVDENKVIMHIISRSGNGKLVSPSTDRIKTNLINYISRYRMINDFVEINDGKIINLRVKVDLLIDGDNFNSKEIKQAGVKEVADFFSVEKWQMNENIYESQIVDLLQDVPGVINVIDIKFFNMQDGGYSGTLHPQAGSSTQLIPETGGYITEIDLVDNSIKGLPLVMFEIMNVASDINFRVASL
jgi:hypothetical protein|tara:strand:+ start:24105 stop:25976 length:1872 start_codon:yes stop_codon:yes gene_type:complete